MTDATGSSTGKRGTRTVSAGGRMAVTAKSVVMATATINAARGVTGARTGRVVTRAGGAEPVVARGPIGSGATGRPIRAGAIVGAAVDGRVKDAAPTAGMATGRVRIFATAVGTTALTTAGKSIRC